MAGLRQITKFLDEELRVADFEDSSHNGLQVENDGPIRRVCCGVDAGMELFEAAARLHADLVVCHHGLSRGDSLKRITDLNYRRLGFLIRNNIALYACHLPLDAHPRYGNNILIARALKLQRVKRFARYHGAEIGFCGVLPAAIRYETFKKHVFALTGTRIQTMDFGRKTVRSVAIVSGGAAGYVADAARAGIDVYLTGEPTLAAHNVARDCAVNVVFAGHYATEVFGARALGKLLARKFKLKSDFVDLAIGF